MNKPESEPINQSPDEAGVSPELIGRLRNIAQIVGGDFGMKVEIGQPGGGSFFNPESAKIVFDPLQIKENERLAEFIAGHEGGHRVIEKGPRAIGAKEEFWQELGFSYLMNSIADCADNDWVAKRYPGLAERIVEVYSAATEKENALFTSSEVTQMIQTLGYIPKFVQYGSELIIYWHRGSFSSQLDPSVRQALEKTLVAAQKSWQSIPSSEGRRTEVLARAKERFAINRLEIWPIIKELIEEDKINEQLRQMIEEAIKGEASGQNPLDKLPRGLKKELKKKLDEAKKGAGGDGEKGAPVPMDELSEGLKAKLKEIFDDLPEEKKQELADKAEKILENLEDALNRELGGKLDETKAESHQEHRQRIRQEEANVSAKKTLEENLERSRSAYDRVFKEVAPQVEELYQRLLAILQPQKHPRWRKGFESGGRLDLARAMQYEADRSQYGKLWEKKTIPHKIDYRFSLLVDLSSSMRGGDPPKIEETFKGLVVVAEVLNRLGISCEIIGFNDQLSDKAVVYKGFTERLTPSLRQRIYGMTGEVGGRTPSRRATFFASQRLQNNRGKDNFIITLTDGEPTDDFSAEEVREISRKTGQKLVGVGLGQGTGAVKDLYPASLPNVNLRDLPRQLADLLEDLIRHPNKY